MNSAESATILSEAPPAWDEAEIDKCPQVTVEYPLHGTLFPAEIPPPTIRWSDPSDAHLWKIRIEFSDGDKPLQFSAFACSWKPELQVWKTILQRSLEKTAEMRIAGFTACNAKAPCSAGRVAFATSKDEVGASLFYREVNLPFIEAVKDPSKIRWRFGSISSPQPPPVILEGLPVCGNCHSFAKDGTTLAMDVDYANSKGSYVITPVAKEMRLATSDIITWDDFRRDDGEQTFGLLSQISPDGRYVVSTVKDKSVFVPQPDLAFSQLFFPLRGILAVYDRQTRQFAALPGADNREYVQSNPAWSPDGKWLVFARSKAWDLKGTKGRGKLLLTLDECREFTQDHKPFRFELYRMDFNDAVGGEAKPLEGASDNGLSNYFPKVSPDGRWIVFCRAKNYMLLQPDSEMYIIPANGGTPRRLGGNTKRMNSWHSWSPNSRWIVFSSKANSAYTQLWLTHINDEGESSPAVLLDNLTASDRAANIPEFVAASPTAIQKIQEQFLNDYSFLRAGNEFYHRGDPTNAIRQFEKVLELNPANVEAHQRLGFLFVNVVNRRAEGVAHLRETLRLDPQNACAHHDLGVVLLVENRVSEAIEHLATAVRLLPKGLDRQYNAIDMRLKLGRALLLGRNFSAASDVFAAALRLDAHQAAAHFYLAMALANQGTTDDAVGHFRTAVSLDPKYADAPELHSLFARNYAQAERFAEALVEAKMALQQAKADGNTALSAQMETQIQAYRQHVQ